jgi:hypothetical protein
MKLALAHIGTVLALTSSCAATIAAVPEPDPAAPVVVQAAVTPPEPVPGAAPPPVDGAVVATSDAPPPIDLPTPVVTGALPAGQWVFTNQYGWVWMPYGSDFTAAPVFAGGDPCMYVYSGAWGWRWVAAPWVFGIGPQPYFGVYGYARFGWYGHPWFGHPWYGYARGYPPGYRGVVVTHPAGFYRPGVYVEHNGDSRGNVIHGGGAAPSGVVVSHPGVAPIHEGVAISHSAPAPVLRPGEGFAHPAPAVAPRAPAPRPAFVGARPQPVYSHPGPAPHFGGAVPRPMVSQRPPQVARRPIPQAPPPPRPTVRAPARHR